VLKPDLRYVVIERVSSTVQDCKIFCNGRVQTAVTRV